MKILFQGGWKEDRNSNESEVIIRSYCEEIAKQIVTSKHHLILSSYRKYDKLIAEKIKELTSQAGTTAKKYLTFYLPERIKEMPTIGRVIRMPEVRWWMDERTSSVQFSDAVLAIGGGKGTADSVQKAYLAGKFVFIANAIPGSGHHLLKHRPDDYYYHTPGDADFVSDLNTDPPSFISKVLSTLDSLESKQFSRRVFIVHGRQHSERDKLCRILKALEFEPIVFEQQPKHSMTIIEKLEELVNELGFAFIIYSPDDVGALKGDQCQPRARQNVVFEHGFLVGKLGRDRTCALITGEKMEPPSDMDGVLFESVSDLNREEMIIAKILLAAGYFVNTQSLLS